MQIIKGKEVANQIKAEIAEATQSYISAGKRAPGIAFVQVGDDPASSTYVANIIKAAEKVGFTCSENRLPATASEEEVIALIEKLNADSNIDGIICQQPLPKGLNSLKILSYLAADKDIDSIRDVNAGRLMLGRDGFVPCTPEAVMQLLKRNHFELDGKNVVVLGRSNVVGKPQAILMLRENATVTICHSHTKNLPEIASRADILVTAMGRAKMVGPEYTNPQQVVVDVAINLDENGKLCGDVDYEKVAEHVQAITPVPGGVGPVTNAILLENTLTAYKHHMGL